MNKKICIDGRRDIYSGIGRVSYNLIKYLSIFDNHNKYFILTNEDTYKYYLNLDVKILNINIPLFSLKDLFEIPSLVDEFSLFISPQFYTSPLVKIPTIRFIHDLNLISPVHQHFLDFNEITRRFSGDSIRNMEYILTNYQNKGYFDKFGSRQLNEEMDFNKYSLQNYLYITMILALINSRKIITVSNTSLNELKKYFPQYQEKYTIIYNFLENKFYNQNSFAKLDFILNVAKLDPRKNHFILINAYKKLPENLRKSYKLIIIGNHKFSSANQEYLKNFFSCISSNYWKKYIIYKENITDEELINLYREARFVVSSSLVEGFCFPLVEAMANKTLVLCSDIDINREITQESCVFFKSNDINELTDMMLKILKNKIHEHNIIEKAYEVSENYSVNRLIYHYIDIINEVIENK